MKIPAPECPSVPQGGWPQLLARRGSTSWAARIQHSLSEAFLPGAFVSTSAKEFALYYATSAHTTTLTSNFAELTEPTGPQATVKQLRVEIAALRDADAERAAEVAELRARVKRLEDRVGAPFGGAAETGTAVAEPPVTEVAPIVMAGAWLDQHGDDHKGRWVALKDGELMGAGASLDALRSDLHSRGLSLKRMFVTRVR